MADQGEGKDEAAKSLGTLCKKEEQDQELASQAAERFPESPREMALAANAMIGMDGLEKTRESLSKTPSDTSENGNGHKPFNENGVVDGEEVSKTKEAKADVRTRVQYVRLLTNRNRSHPFSKMMLLVKSLLRRCSSES